MVVELGGLVASAAVRELDDSIHCVYSLDLCIEPARSGSSIGHCCWESGNATERHLAHAAVPVDLVYRMDLEGYDQPSSRYQAVDLPDTTLYCRCVWETRLAFYRKHEQLDVLRLEIKAEEDLDLPRPHSS